MANIIKPKRSTVAAKVPTSAQLSSGEIAVNSTDQKIYTYDGTNVLQIGSGKLSGLADLTLTGLTTGQAITWNGTTWVNSTISAGSTPTLQQVTTAGATSDVAITLSNLFNVSLNAAGTAYQKAFNATNANMASGNELQFTFGRNPSNYNLVEFTYHYLSNNSTSNYVSIGFYGATNRGVFVNGTGQTAVGFNTESPTFNGALNVSGIINTTSTGSSTNWNTAYGWGNHASAGYLSSGSIGSTVQAYDSNLTTFLSAFNLPTTDSTSGYVLATNGSGTLSFVEQSGGGSGITTGKAIAMAIVFG